MPRSWRIDRIRAPRRLRAGCLAACLAVRGTASKVAGRVYSRHALSCATTNVGYYASLTLGLPNPARFGSRKWLSEVRSLPSADEGRAALRAVLLPTRNPDEDRRTEGKSCRQ